MFDPFTAVFVALSNEVHVKVQPLARFARLPGKGFFTDIATVTKGLQRYMKGFFYRILKGISTDIERTFNGYLTGIYWIFNGSIKGLDGH